MRGPATIIVLLHCSSTWIVAGNSKVGHQCNIFNKTRNTINVVMITRERMVEGIYTDGYDFQPRFVSILLVAPFRC